MDHTTLVPLPYRIAFASLKGMNPMLADSYLELMGNEEAFFKASSRQLCAVTGCNTRIFSDSYRAELLEKAKRETDFIEANGIRPVYFSDPAYPKRMRDVPDAPIMLYTLGNVDLNRARMLSIVGTRHATPYGLDFVNRLISELAAKLDDKLVVISGLALGIDAAAHSAALRNGIPTIGVLAHGLNMIYPSQHRNLASDMVRNNGLLLTEYRSDSPVHKGNFVARNRIVAALCDALVVAESAKKGGALITAGLAGDYDRDVFALPGRTSDRFSQGCNRLIASNKAALIQNADELIDAMNWPRHHEAPVQPSLFVELTEEEQAVIDLLTMEDTATLQKITMKLNLPSKRVMPLLIEMEFKNLILSMPGAKYRLA